MMAFHNVGTYSELGKDEIVRAATPYCDHPFEDDYHAGIYTGGPNGTPGWKSIDVLQKHGFVVKTRVGRRFSYALTDKGTTYIATVLCTDIWLHKHVYKHRHQ